MKGHQKNSDESIYEKGKPKQRSGGSKATGVEVPFGTDNSADCFFINFVKKLNI